MGEGPNAGCIELTLTKASGPGLGASDVGFGMYCQHEAPGGKPLWALGRRVEIGLRFVRLIVR
jgi:hypothetical protein